MSSVPAQAADRLTGWRTVSGSLICLALGVSCVVFYCFSVFVPSLQAAFGWSRTEVSLALSLASFATVAVMPVLGSLLDRFGARPLLLFSALALSCLMFSMTWLSSTGSLVHFYAMYILLPLLAAGTQPVVFSRAIVMWFDQGRGLALGIALSGAGLGAMLLPPIVTDVIARHGWSAGYAFLGALSLLVALPCAYLLVAERPGLAGHGASGPSADLRFAELLTHGAIRPMLASFVLLGVALTGLLAHFTPIATDAGLSTAMAAYVSSVFGAAVIVGRIASGVLMDRYAPPVVGFLFLLGPAIGALVFAFGSGAPAFLLAAALCGLAMGSEFSMLGFFVARLFPMAGYGRYYGVIYASFLLGGALGPLVLGASVDQLGSYRWGLLLLSLLTLAGAWLILEFRRLPQFRSGM